MATYTVRDVEEALSREQIVELLEADGFQCFDEESKSELAAVLADHLNTEGATL
jgi:hypothetical protein